ncbi:glycosyl transferase [Zobellella endophytica]|uniref:Glycosyl transferase n=2 Tax=Zobellella endophytica TaxID=2116700 RepID=A0A2P7R440_9GAMM|nr:glycosyl transferase [Zobellella endophytica]
MSQKLERRYSRWYQSVLLHSFTQFFIGVAAVVLLPCLLWWGGQFWQQWDEVRVTTVISNFLCFFVVFVFYKRFHHFPGAQSLFYVIPTIVLVYLLAFAALFFVRAGYSRPVLLLSLGLAVVCFFAGHFVRLRVRRLQLAVVPFGEQPSLRREADVDACTLAEPAFHGRRFDAVIADLRADLPAEWQTFLARCTLAHVPVYHVRQIRERLTGRIKIEHLSENEFGTLLPDPNYAFIKRVTELLLVLATLPLWLPLLLATAVLIRLESPGPALFVQQRVGQGGRLFNMYKLRSMYLASPGSGARFAGANDSRVTRVGRFIRRTRLDEVPQFFNVLKGDMSLIGPRPEQREFVAQFERQIPFYVYRHVVRPGITGWAQVRHGYAASADDTRIKIEHDFYYIKHFSFWLDLLVVYKTLQTMVTGFGAR